MQSDLVTGAWDALVALPTWQGFLAVVGGSLLLAVLIQVGGDALIRRITRRIPGDVDKVIFRTLHPPLYVTVVLVGAYVAVRLFDVTTAWETELRAGLQTLLAVMWAYTLIRMGRLASNEATSDERYDNQVVPIFQNVWTAVVLGAGLYVMLWSWSVNVTPLLASAGVVGIVLGLAAKDTIANLFGSIALYADRTYTVGDFVLLETGERGRVEDISIRSTDIRTRDDTLVTVPNSTLNTATIVNESSPERETRLTVSLGVGYDSDLDHVEAVLLDVAEAERLVVDDPRPRVRVREFAASAITVHLKCWIAAPTHRGRVRHRLLKAVHAAFTEDGIEIPFPQRVVTMADQSAKGDGDAVPRVERSGAETARPTDVGEKWADTSGETINPAEVAGAEAAEAEAEAAGAEASGDRPDPTDPAVD